MRARNQHLYSADQDWLNMIADELRQAGRDVDLEPGHLIAYALPKHHKKSPPQGPSRLKESEVSKDVAKRNKTKRERWYGAARD